MKMFQGKVPGFHYDGEIKFVGLSTIGPSTGPNEIQSGSENQPA